jgi:predicted transcriptional regulator of viral defense system
MRTSWSGPAGRFVETLLGQGRYTFTRKDAEARLGRGSSAVYFALYRLVKSGWLIMPRSGFYVIVDPQHRAAGTLPPEWFIDELMRYMRRPYYVGLLSAAQLFGAAHHRPQEFQVVIPRRAARPVHAGNVLVRFYGKGCFDRARLQDVKTPTGVIRASTPATTAWDLVRYVRSAGGLDHVTTVLSELADKLDAAALRDIVKRHRDILVAQRLGYLLDRVGRRDLTHGLAAWVKTAPVRALDAGASLAGARESRKWRLKVNAHVEPET